ncbi:hypothetical protein DFH08DRAFT_975227 [Mycena albidolilacea]|uniref:Nephrocystin 3-like N-terminal domain-containing protein n=1 Tax=Mycena albidolilacea TaxID=1033008 RepID=A0AAD6Z5E6_9AGAR|nr:hypothetical protein DFH08DRAFT_975227 [Mycena albidolilacea]
MTRASCTRIFGLCDSSLFPRSATSPGSQPEGASTEYTRSSRTRTSSSASPTPCLCPYPRCTRGRRHRAAHARFCHVAHALPPRVGWAEHAYPASLTSSEHEHEHGYVVESEGEGSGHPHLIRTGCIGSPYRMSASTSKKGRRRHGDGRSSDPLRIRSSPILVRSPESEAIEGRKNPTVDRQNPPISQTDDRRFIEDTTPPLYFSGALNSVGDNATRVNLISHGKNGLDLLYRSVLQDAMHNSAERRPEPSCHEGTHDLVLSDLWAWSQDDRREGSLLWLYGSAGMGKSAVVNFAANCAKEGTLGASFFFKRRDARRGTWKGLFPTLAYQLATTFEELRGSIHEAVEDDRLVVGQAMLHQFQKLLVVPLNQALPLRVHPIIVIDGLDECEDRGVQVQLLKLIIDELRTGRLPVRFLIASRPEPHLREVLQTFDNFDFCRHIELRPDESAYAAIRRYFCDEFSRIRCLHHSRGIPLEDDWPGQSSINHLVEKSSGTFIYATTVLRYIDDEYSHPADRLDAVLHLDPHSTAPLDNLYTQIMSAIPERSTLRRVLHAMVRTELDPEEIDAALQLRTGTSRLVLRGLHSVVRVPPVRTIGFRCRVELLYGSLFDFLLDPLRSLELCVVAPDLDSQLVHCMAASLSTTLSGGLRFRSVLT